MLYVVEVFLVKVGVIIGQERRVFRLTGIFYLPSPYFAARIYGYIKYCVVSTN